MFEVKLEPTQVEHQGRLVTLPMLVALLRLVALLVASKSYCH
jgi:hypothetical protein